MSDLKSQIAQQIAAHPDRVWVPTDFARLSNRDAVDKVLQRLVAAGELRRIDRGLYDKPTTNPLTKRLRRPDYRAILDAIVRRDQIRVLVDGLTAANDLGLTDAVPARVVVLTDARRKKIRVDNLMIEFKQVVPSRLYWSGRPAMRVVQALHWSKDMLATQRMDVLRQLHKVLFDKKHGKGIRQDLIDGFPALPAWMQDELRLPLNLGIDGGMKCTP